MTGYIEKTSQHKAAKVAGIMFLFSLIVPSLNWAFILSKLVVAENVVATANNIMSNEFQFRIGITVELIMSLGLVVLGLELYIVLKNVNKNLDLFALIHIYTRTVADPCRINPQHAYSCIFCSHGISWPGHDVIFLFVFQIEVYPKNISRFWSSFICAYFHSRSDVYSCTKIRHDADKPNHILGSKRSF